jgi:hypothetical protein
MAEGQPEPGGGDHVGRRAASKHPDITQHTTQSRGDDNAESNADILETFARQLVLSTGQFPAVESAVSQTSLTPGGRAQYAPAADSGGHRLLSGEEALVTSEDVEESYSDKNLAESQSDNESIELGPVPHWVPTNAVAAQHPDLAGVTGGNLPLTDRTDDRQSQPLRLNDVDALVESISYTRSLAGSSFSVGAWNSGTIGDRAQELGSRAGPSQPFHGVTEDPGSVFTPELSMRDRAPAFPSSISRLDI